MFKDLMGKDMLKKDKFILYTFMLCGHMSCNIIPDNRALYFEKVSKNTVTISEYNRVYGLINDSISSWRDAKIEFYIEKKGETESIIDSLLCFNSEKNRLITAILTKTLLKDAVMDGITFLFGEKIDGQWCFFSEAHIVLPREYYQKDIHTPLSFEKMHEIALKEVYGGYLIKKLFGSYEINDAWVNAHFEGVSWCDTCKTRADYEKVHLEKVKNNWYWRDTTNVVKP